MNRGLLGISIVWLVLWAASCPVIAQTPDGPTAQPAGHATWRDDMARCTITLPPGWVFVSQADVETRNSEIRAMVGSDAPQYAAGMAPEPPDGRYGLVQVAPLPRGSATYDQIEKSLGAASQTSQADAQQRLGDFVSNLKLDQMVLDRDRNRVTMRTAMSDALGTSIEGVSFMHLGARHMVMVHCYAPAKEFAANAGVFERISQGVAFDPGAEFVPATLSPTLRGIVIGAGVGGLLGLFAYFKNKRSERRGATRAA